MIQNQRIGVYSSTPRITVLAQTAQLEALLEAKRRREARMQKYSHALNDHNTYDSDKERFKKELEHATEVNKRHTEEIKHLMAERGRPMLKTAIEAPKVPMKVGAHELEVPKQSQATVEKFKDDPDFKKVVDDVAKEPVTDAEGKGNQWTAGRVAKYAIITSGIGYLAFKLRNVTLQDLTDMMLLFLAMR